MRKNSPSQAAWLTAKFAFACPFCAVSIVFALFGFAGTSSGSGAGLSERSRGTSLAAAGQPLLGQWTIVNSPNTSAAQNNYLTTVSCAGAGSCWAAGYYYDANNRVKTLVEHKGPSGWTIEQAPTPTNGLQDLLTAVTCVSATDCSGVGYYDNNSLVVADTVDTLTEHFDGTSWSVLSSANAQNSTDSRLWSVSCPSTNDCWAVGEYSAPGVFSLTPSSVFQTLIEQNTGSGWSIVTSPNITVPAGRSDPTGQTENTLLGVSCAGATDCWAVGWYYNAQGISQPLVEHYDGSAWSIGTTANPGYSALEAINCFSANDCWAVGWYVVTSGPYQTLIEHYDGSTWTIATSPNSSTDQNNELFGVTCASATDCWSVGFSYNDSTSPYHTLIAHYDGASWSIMSSPNTGGTDSDYLTGVACSSSKDCWAIGYYYDAVGGNTLTEHYTVPVQLNAIASRLNHGAGNTFDLNLTSGNGIECRSGGANGNYTILFSFASPLAAVSGASVTAGVGSVASSSIDSSDAHNYIVNLTGVTNAQVITVSLSNVTDSVGDFSSAVSASMGVLVGDVNGNGVVSNTDVSLVKAQVAAAVGSTNFREDVNANGVISNTDVSLTKAQVGATLPSPP